MTANKTLRFIVLNFKVFNTHINNSITGKTQPNYKYLTSIEQDRNSPTWGTSTMENSSLRISKRKSWLQIYEDLLFFYWILRFDFRGAGTNRKREIDVPVRREESTSEEVIGGAAFLLGRGIFANCAIKTLRDPIESIRKPSEIVKESRNPIHRGREWGRRATLHRCKV